MSNQNTYRGPPVQGYQVQPYTNGNYQQPVQGYPIQEGKVVSNSPSGSKLEFNPVVNFNRLHGTPEDIDLLNRYIKEDPVKLNKALIDQNRAFVQAVITAVTAKNKLDYPPSGPTSKEKQQFQAMKITQIMNAIQQEYSQKYGYTGMLHSVIAGFETLGAWIGNTSRGVGRVGTAPSSTYKSAKAMFGFGGRRRKHRKTLKKQK